MKKRVEIDARLFMFTRECQNIFLIMMIKFPIMVLFIKIRSKFGSLDKINT